MVTALAATTGGTTIASASADQPASPTRAMITPDARVANLISQMTLDEKLSFVSPSLDPLNKDANGNQLSPTVGSAAYLPGVPRLGIPEMRYTDGTAGLRLPVPTTAYPAPTMLGSTFDPDLAYDYGTTLGTQARAVNQDVVLGPMATLIREPQGGRNYEAFGEDPLLVSQMVAPEVEGLQDAGVIATIKHLAMNDQETNKGNVNAQISDQALHEVQMAGFQAGVDAGAGAAMCAYNKVNGVYSCSNDDLMNQILKTQMNFQGYIMSDWGVAKAVTDMNAGLDQEMFWVGIQGAKLTTALRTALDNGTVSIATVNDAVARILTSMEKVGLLDGASANRPTFDLATGASMAQKIAEQGGVLLKNGGTLPLKTGKTVAVLGDSAATPKTTGVLSAAVSSVNPASPLQTITTRAQAAVTTSATPVATSAPFPSSALANATGFPFDASGASTGTSLAYSGTLNITTAGLYTFTAGKGLTVTIDGTQVAKGSASAAVAGDVTLTAGAHTIVLAGTGTAVGSSTFTWSTPADWATAMQPSATVAAAASAAVVVVADSIPGDRSTSLSARQNLLISTVGAANPHTVVVLDAASAVVMPWIDQVDGVLDMYYPGVNGAQATTALLYGDVNPSGKLTQTFPVSDTQTPFAGNAAQYPGVNNVVSYSEGVNVGYRGYQKDGITPLFPFGYGLSYTTFSYGEPTVKQQGDNLMVSVKLTNTGDRAGQEVVQAYSGPSATVTAQQADRKLVGFTKVSLEAGESRTVEFPVALHQMEYWDTPSQSWKLGTGIRTFWVGDSSADLDHATTARIASPLPGDGPTVTVNASPTASTSGWNQGPVTVSADTAPNDASTYISVDSGKVQPYTGPIQVSDDGVHDVKVFAVGADERYSDITDLTVRIDSGAPTASATAADGRLTLAGSDSGSGIGRLEYSLDNNTWNTYSTPVDVPGAPRAVSYRAVDLAGNVSEPQVIQVPAATVQLPPVSVPGTIHVGKVRVAGSKHAGAKLTARTSGWTSAVTFHYTWTVKGKTVGTTSKLTVKPAWRGKTVKLVVTATKSGYASASAHHTVHIRR